ncbi:MAG: hypothetical protein ACREFE_03960 [Limisphaerales bacterium]
MKVFSRFQMLVFCAATLTIATAKTEAQNLGFVLSVIPSADSVAVSNTLTYTISLDNFSGDSFPTLFVTNTFSSAAPIDTPTNSQASTFFTNTDETIVVFQFGSFPAGDSAQIILPVHPLATGSFTNTIAVSAGTGTTNLASTYIITQVTNAVTLANVSLSITGPVQVVITNDWMTYGVTVTNSGTSAASGVTLTNTLPPGVLFKGVSPNVSYQTIAATNLVFNLGTLQSGSYTNLQFTVEPTAAGVLTFSASIGGNTASTNITVTNYLSGAFVATTNSAQILNFQNGLEEQSITVSNAGSSATSVRVIVSGLTTKRLFNAFGTNNGNPFVVYPATLAVGGSVNLLLQYAPRPSFPFTNGQLHAFAVPMPNLTPPTAFAMSTNISFKSIQLANGEPLIEFSAITNRTYTVVYSDNLSFSNAMIAPPSVVAPANVVQWIDYGPPETASAPTNSGSRYYRVFQNP